MVEIGVGIVCENGIDDYVREWNWIWRSSPFEILNILEHSVQEWASSSSVCMSDNVSVTIDGLPGDSSKKSKKNLDLHQTGNLCWFLPFSNFCAVLSRQLDVFQHIAKNNKNWTKHPDCLFSLFTAFVFQFLIALVY